MRIRFFFIWILLLTCPLGIFGQSVEVLYPHLRQIFQRNSLNEATFSVLGNCKDNSTLVQFKLVPVEKGQGVAIDWSNLDESPGGGFFQGKIKAKGGWYALWVRSMGENKVWQDSSMLSRVGVGENFIIAGQSNAQGTNRRPQEPGAKDDRVNCANFYNFFEEYNAGANTSQLGFLNQDFKFTNFSQLSGSASIGPMGTSPYYWANLGDLLVNKFNVPVCFYNVAWGGTSIRNWAESSRGISSQNPWNASLYYQQGFPYNNLKNIATTFGGNNGFRSVLWHQGETDSYLRMPKDTYINYFKELINTFRIDSKVDIPWIVSEASFISFPNNSGGCSVASSYSPVIDAQKDILSLSDLLGIYRGPNTDIIEIPRKSDDFSGCVHFSPESYQQVSQAWEFSISASIERNNSPVVSQEFPVFEKYCGPQNELLLSTNSKNKVSLINSLGVEYPFNSGEKVKIKPDVYSLIITNSTNNQFVIPNFKLSTSPIPAAPLLTSDSKSEFCEGDSIMLKLTNIDQLVFWSTGENTSQITVKESGSFKALTKNKYGCTSNYSNEVKTIKLPKPIAPLLTSVSKLEFCEGDSITLKLTNIDQIIVWSSGENTTQITVKETGSFKAFTKNKYGCNSNFSNEIKTLKLAKPLVPVIATNNSLNFCDGESINLSVQAKFSKYTWNNGSDQQTINVKSSGEFNVFVTNEFGCKSGVSNNIKTTVFQNPSTPMANLLSPYFLTVGQKTSDVDFNWSFNNVAINTEKGSNLRVKTSGKYSVFSSKKYVNGPTCVSPTFDIIYTLPQDGGLSIFPNPAGNIVTIQSVSSLQGSEFTIYAMDGRQITQGKISQDGSYVMNLAGINSGNYKLVLRTNDQLLYTKTLIISN